MSRLEWDKTGEHYFETGVDHGVLYVYGVSSYGTGVAWNGLTAVNQNPTGADANALYADNIKYLNLFSNEEFGCTIEAYTYPDEFAQCNGEMTLSTINGITIGQQPRKMFGFSYRTLMGNDVVGSNLGYKIHLVYGAMASPSDKNYETVNDNPDAINFSWEVTTTPVEVSGYKPTAHLEIDSTKVSAGVLAALEDVLWGSNSSSARLPLPDEIISIVNGAHDRLATPSVSADDTSQKITITVASDDPVESFDIYEGDVFLLNKAHVAAATSTEVTYAALGYTTSDAGTHYITVKSQAAEYLDSEPTAAVAIVVAES